MHFREALKKVPFLDLLSCHYASHFPTIPPHPPARSMFLFYNPNPSKFVVCTKPHYFCTTFLGFAVFFFKVPEGPKARLDVQQVPLHPLFFPLLHCYPNRLFFFFCVQSPQTHCFGGILDSLSRLDQIRYPMPLATPTVIVLRFGLSLPFIFPP